MKNERFLIFILALVQFTHIIDFMIVMPLGKTFMETFDISPQQFTFIVSSYSLAAFFMSLVAAFFMDLYDRKTTLLFIYVGFTLGTFACFAADSYYFFLAARSITGAFGGILSALILSIIADVFPYERRATAMGFVMTAFSVASVVGVPLGVYLAASDSWRTPFLAVGILAVVVVVLIFFFVPNIRIHLENKKDRTPQLQVIKNIFQNKNQATALGFNMILMLGHFTIIPFIAPYMQTNIGFSDYDVTYIYLIGGGLTVVLLPLFGKLSDVFGNIKVFTFGSLFAVFSIYSITNLEPVGIGLALVVTSSFFVAGSGRNVPAITIVTSVVKPEHRGSFMSLRTSVVQLTLGMSSFLAGFIVVENRDGTLSNYHLVGYFAIGMSILALMIAPRLKTAS